MSDRVDITVAVHTEEADASIEATKAKADATVEQWRLDRMEIIQGVRESITLISTMMSSYRQFMSIIGAQVDPFYSALIGMTLSTISMLLSLSAVLALTVVWAPVAVVIASIGIGLQIATLVKLIKDKADTSGTFNNLNNRIAGNIARIGKGMLGGF